MIGLIINLSSNSKPRFSMRPPPPDWPRISPSLFYEDAARAIDWLCEAFGFEVRLKVETGDGGIAHSELTYGEGVVMVGASGRRVGLKSPRALDGASTQALMVYVDDVEAHCQRAQAAGAKIIGEIKTSDYGEDYWSDRSYEAEDCEGHRWYFAQRLRSPKVPPPRYAKEP
jgi:uncharacterized glyoxalase superfamily protein PhnB